MKNISFKTAKNDIIAGIIVALVSIPISMGYAQIAGLPAAYGRKERGLKATEVIAKLQLENVNVTTGIFSKVENGYNNPTVDMLVALTKIFECDFNEFFKTE